MEPPGFAVSPPCLSVSFPLCIPPTHPPYLPALPLPHNSYSTATFPEPAGWRVPCGWVCMGATLAPPCSAIGLPSPSPSPSATTNGCPIPGREVGSVVTSGLFISLSSPCRVEPSLTEMQMAGYWHFIVIVTGYRLPSVLEEEEGRDVVGASQGLARAAQLASPLSSMLPFRRIF